MRKMAILHESEVDPQSTYPVPVEVTGLLWSKSLSPPDYVLWLCLSEIDAGGQITWPAEHSDQAIYVFSGSLSVGDHLCPEGGAIIVESNVPATVTAVQHSRIGHWGSWDPVVPEEGLRGPIRDAAHRIHVIGPNGIYTSGNSSDVAVRSFANSACDTCRISLFEVTRDHERAGRPHSHSADEIIYLLSGTIELGAHTLQPGASLCIPGGVRYAEGSGPGGAVFINYRREPSDRTNLLKGKVVSVETEGPGERMGGIDHINDVVHVSV